MLSALACAILVAQCSGPYCTPDSDFERPAGDAKGVAAAPDLAVAPDGAALLVWESRRDGEPDVLFRRREPGRDPAWLAAPVRLDGGEPGAARSLEPRLAAGPGGAVYAVWQDRAFGRDAILFSRSSDGGRTWARREAPLGGGPAASSMASLAAAGDDVFVAWEDLGAGERDIRFARSGDRGATWDDARDVGTDEAGRAASWHPQIAAWPDGGLVVAWWDDRDGLSDLYVRRSRDGGRSWEGPEVRLDPGAPGETASRDASLAVAGDRMVVAWEEQSADGTPSRLVWRASDDRGATWGELAEAGRGRDPVPLASATLPTWIAWLVNAAGTAERTSIGGRIVDIARPVRLDVRAPGEEMPVPLSSVSGPASLWAGASADRFWAARTGTDGGRAVLEVFENRGTGTWAPAVELRFGLDFLATQVEITAHALRGAVGADGVVHFAWIADYGGAGDVGYFRLQP
jgi:hypothetical protein